MQFVKILNNDRILLSRTNVQNWVLTILNTKISEQERHELFPETSETRQELLKLVGTLDLCNILDQITNMNVERLLSLIHALTGEYPTVLYSSDAGGVTETNDANSLQNSTQSKKSVSQR